MKQVFRAHRLCKQDGPMGPYIDSYEAEMRGEGYARQTRGANPFGRRFRLLFGQAWNPGAGHYLRFVSAVPSCASTTSTATAWRQTARLPPKSMTKTMPGDSTMGRAPPQH